MALQFLSNCFDDASWFANIPLFESLPKVTLDPNKRRRVKQTTSLLALVSPEETFISFSLLCWLDCWKLVVFLFFCFMSGENITMPDKFVPLCVFFPEETTNYSNSPFFYYLLESVSGLPLRPVFFLTVCQCRTHTICICLLLFPGNKVVWQSSSSETAALSCCATSPVALRCKTQSHRLGAKLQTVWQQGCKIIGRSWSTPCAGAALVMDDPVSADWGWSATGETLPSRSRHLPSGVVMNLKLIKSH